MTLLLCLSLSSETARATPQTPPALDTVVASWQVSSELKTATNSLDVIGWHIQQGQFPGQANLHYGRARALLSPLLDKKIIDPEVWYLWARALQHQHQFSDALMALEEVLKLDKYQTNALLLKANILLQQNNFSVAQQSCTRLIGQINILVVAACGLEVASYQGKLTNSYQQLKSMLNRYVLRNDQSSIWMVQLVADMAMRMDKVDTAAAWLDRYPLDDMPLSYIVLWADVQLAQNNHQNLLETLGEIVKKAAFKDDALLVRLTLAEKHTGKNIWRKQLDKRIQLRELRGDTYHAADLARYYIAIHPTPRKALHWAKINWQQAKLNDDKLLLAQAHAMQSPVNQQQGSAE